MLNAANTGMKTMRFPQIQDMTRDYILDHVLPQAVYAGHLDADGQSRFPCMTIPGTDLVATFYIMVRGENCHGTVSVTDAIMARAGLTPQELYSAAAKNVRAEMEIVTMLDALSVLVDVHTSSGEELCPAPLWVVSTKSKVLGAGIMAGGADVFRTVGEALAAPAYFILPSSVHEVLVTPDTGAFTFDELLQIVMEVNSSVVSTQDYLSDNVYRYDCQTGTLMAYKHN